MAFPSDLPLQAANDFLENIKEITNKNALLIIYRALISYSENNRMDMGVLKSVFEEAVSIAKDNEKLILQNAISKVVGLNDDLKEVLTIAGQMTSIEFEESKVEARIERKNTISDLCKSAMNPNMSAELLEAKLLDAASKGLSNNKMLDEFHKAGISSNTLSQIYKYANLEIQEIISDSVNGKPAGNIYRGIGVNGDRFDTGGFKVHEVFKETSAEKLGLKSGDIIKNVGGVNLSKMSLREMNGAIRNAGGKDKYVVEVERNGKIITFGEGKGLEPSLINKKYKSCHSYLRLYDDKQEWLKQYEKKSKKAGKDLKQNFKKAKMQNVIEVSPPPKTPNNKQSKGSGKNK